MQELIKDALKNVWSIPDPNSQVIIQPGRISADSGASRVINIGWTKVGLPDTTSIWHVFQIGQIHPLLLNLFDVKNQWESVSDASNRRQLVCNLYNEYGVEIPRTRTYYLRMPDNNLVIAVEKNAKIDVDFSAQALYVRIFRNQYFQSADSEEAVKIEVGGGKMAATSDITELTDRILALRDTEVYGGQVLCFVNGYKVESINVANTKVGDVAEYVYDASIYNTSEYHISSLQSFRSVLDNKAKWLLFSEADWDGYLDHCFNIDIYLIDKVTGKGVYVHKNAADTLRMVTFKDYSICSDYVQAYFTKFVDPVTKNLLVNNLYLRLHVRQDSYRQIPQDDANKTTYLLRMTNAQQQAAMVGVDSSNLIWRAENLENSAYNRLMEARYENVTLGLVESAYGYSNANRILCPNVQPCQAVSAQTDAGSFRTIIAHCEGNVNVEGEGLWDGTGSATMAGLGWDTAKFGTLAMRFYGNWSCYAAFMKTWSIPLLDDFTVDVWVNPYSYPASDVVTILAHEVDMQSFLNLEMLPDGTLRLRVGQSNPVQAASVIALDLNVYSHVALTRHGDLFTVWINGQPGLTLTSDLRPVNADPSHDNTWFGRPHWYDNATRYWNGCMDEIRIIRGLAAYRAAFVPQNGPFTIADTKIVSERAMAPVPVGFMTGSTAYEYSADGKLLGIYPVDPNVGEYACTQAASFVEFIEGIGGRALNESYGNDSVPTNTENAFPIIKTTHHYRCYEQINGVWTDVTSGDTYAVVNGEVFWKMESSNNRLIRSDAKHLAYKVQLNPTDGVLVHSVSYPQENGNANIAVPMGEYDFWLNGYPLIEGIDYTFNFPLVEIISKEYLNSAPGPQELTVRMFGLCRADLTPYRSKEVGFVFDGDMSVNDRYDLHEFKSLRVVSAGALIAPTKHTFVEAISSGVLNNGAPYEIRELCNSMKGFIVSDAYKLRERNEAVEKSVGDYLTLKVKPVTDSPINPIPDKYKLYSPFICKILFALKAGNIQASKISGQYADSVVEGLVAPYLPILKGDPIYQNNTPDLSYCVIHPHWLDTTVYVTEDAFRFLTNVVRMYARGKVELSPLVAIGSVAV